MKLYVKLPRWFVVPTRVCDYNPDWAIVMQDTDESGEATGKPLLYLVSETKGTADRLRLKRELRPDEWHKIVCGEKHFEEGLKECGLTYKVVSKVRELR